MFKIVISLKYSFKKTINTTGLLGNLIEVTIKLASASYGIKNAY